VLKGVISTTPSLEKTNSNANKPDILLQLFKAFVWNNRTPNGRQKGNLSTMISIEVVDLIVYMYTRNCTVLVAK
jgi:hypothetical protein